jgi:hypothetical protein
MSNMILLHILIGSKKLNKNFHVMILLLVLKLRLPLVSLLIFLCFGGVSIKIKTLLLFRPLGSN